MELEEELKVVGNSLKSLEVSEEKVKELQKVLYYRSILLNCFYKCFNLQIRFQEISSCIHTSFALYIKWKAF